MYVLTPPQPEREMISLRLRLFAFELFKAAKLSSSSGTPDFQQWNSGIPPVELSSSTLGFFWNSTPLFFFDTAKLSSKA